MVVGVIGSVGAQGGHGKSGHVAVAVNLATSVGKKLVLTFYKRHCCVILKVTLFFLSKRRRYT